MSQLDNLVENVISDFVSAQALFTALDVSNKVKDTMPFARHREVRDIVRTAFSNVFSMQGYTRSTIGVSLDDGTVVDAILYHHVSDSSDIDSKYGDQNRGISKKPVVAAPVAMSVVAAPITPAVKQTDTKTLWMSLFDTQASLFPRK